MKFSLFILFILCSFCDCARRAPIPLPRPQNQPQTNTAPTQEQKLIGSLARQLLLQQLYIEEKSRSEGDSGIKQNRHGMEGTRPYFSDTHTLRSVASIHDHANNNRTVGMGEFVAVLNGVEFRTRHNDYALVMPHRQLNNYHKTERIPFPNVPREVLAKQGLSAQIAEMREWFKAWKNGSTSPRDYRPYFKPILCYLEGAWTTKIKSMEEPFDSDRHFIDADNWFDLQEKIRFTAYTGDKSNLENFAYLPTTIMNVLNETFPVFAQWNYRILCHPLKTDIPLNRFRPVDDLGARMTRGLSMESFARTRAARFQLNPYYVDNWPKREVSHRYNVLDKLMGEIPGKDNYPVNMTDSTFGLKKLHYNGKNVVFNPGYYHRWYRVNRKGAMGSAIRHRGFSDANLFMAQNSRPEVAPITLTQCRGRSTWRRCTQNAQRWSYAIPLEIIYLTPLLKWNPYNIQFKGHHKSPLGKTAYTGGRNGQATKEKAFNGSTSALFYHTPAEFFYGPEIRRDPADTTRKKGVGILDRTGNVRTTVASGTRIMLPNIPGVGSLRTRWPILPIHSEGSPAWKEIEALKDVVKQQNEKMDLIINAIANASGSILGTLNINGPKPSLANQYCKRDYSYRIRPSLSTKTTSHTHTVNINAAECEDMLKGATVTKVTTVDNSHDHTLVLKMTINRQKRMVVYMMECDGTKITKWNRVCWDKHPRSLVGL